MSRCGWHVFSLQLGYWCLQAWFCIPNLAVHRTAIKPPFGLSNLWSECADNINLQESAAAANPQNQTYLIRHCFWFTSCAINKMPIYYSLTEASISIPFGGAFLTSSHPTKPTFGAVFRLPVHVHRVFCHSHNWTLTRTCVKVLHSSLAWGCQAPKKNIENTPIQAN